MAREGGAKVYHGLSRWIRFTSPLASFADAFAAVAVSRLSAAVLVAASAPICGAFADDGVRLFNISQNTPYFGSVFPEVQVSRTAPNVVAVAWRRYGLPVNTNGSMEGRTADCHVSVSTDAGDTFYDTNLMPYLREPAVNVNEPEPNLYFCNAPWVAFGLWPVMYAGGSAFTPNGVLGPLPKQGRALVISSRDLGKTWSQPTYGIRFNNFAPGLTGLSGGTTPPDTPWDGSFGFVDPGYLSLYSTSGAYVTESNDIQAQQFNPVYELTSAAVPGWTVSTVGVMNASYGVLGAPFFATASPVPGAICPCLAYATSVNNGQTWSAQLVAQASQFNSDVTGDTARSPFSASDPNPPGTRVAISAYTPDHTSVQVFYTENGGRSWESATAAVPVDVPVTTAKKVSVAYTLDGRILVVWRGFQASGEFDTFAALLHGDHFGKTIRVSPKSSTYPYLTTQAACTSLLPSTAACYDTSNGSGDFITSITGNSEYAFVAFPYMAGGFIEDTYFAKIPLSNM